VLFGFNPAGADGRLAALADDRKHDLADPAEILTELAQAAERPPNRWASQPRIPATASHRLMRRWPSAARRPPATTALRVTPMPTP
jgi:hypothetical protein